MAWLSCSLEFNGADLQFNLEDLLGGVVGEKLEIKLKLSFSWGCLAELSNKNNNNKNPHLKFLKGTVLGFKG